MIRFRRSERQVAAESSVAPFLRKIIELADAGMKQTEIAKKLKISVATVYRYLAKERDK